MAKIPPLLLLLLFLLLGTTVHGRLASHSSLANVFTSDGVHDHLPEPPPLDLVLQLTEESCEETYGFMPCTTTVIGNLFLIMVYGYLMFLAAMHLSTGSELLLDILGPGIVGGLFLPVLRSFPDAMLILVSGLSGSTEKAQYKVSAGMGLLAGTTTTLLTIVWGSCVVAGKCDLNEHSVAIDNQDEKGFTLSGSGITTDIWTKYIARIMAISIIPFIIVQIPVLALHSTSGRHLAVLVSLIVSLLLLISYCLYQVSHPWIQKKQIDYAKHKHVVSGILKHFKMSGLGRLLTDDGEINKEVLKKLFETIDLDSDGRLSDTEVKALIIGIQFDEMDLTKFDAVDKLMKDFDTSNNNYIELNEFISGISKWLEVAKQNSGVPHQADSMENFNDFHQKTKTEHYLLGELAWESDEVVEGGENSRRIMFFKAVLKMLVGTIIAIVFADPLVDAVDNFSSATSIPSFFISFIALPFATNISEWVSTIITAKGKKMKYATLSFSEIYGVVTMNNLLCLSVFTAIIYIRGLTWNFSAEVLVILIVCIVMSAFASFRTTFPFWTSLVAFPLYPFSLVVIYILNYVLGWA